jgi:hypothetical protein
LPTASAHYLIETCVATIAPAYPEQALTRLHQLARHVDDGVRGHAANAITELTGARESFLYFLQRLAKSPQAEHDIELFATLVTPSRLMRPDTLGHPGIDQTIVELWTIALARQLPGATGAMIWQWLADEPILRQILLAAAGGNRRLLSQLYATTLAWYKDDLAGYTVDKDEILTQIKNAIYTTLGHV